MTGGAALEALFFTAVFLFFFFGCSESDSESNSSQPLVSEDELSPADDEVAGVFVGTYNNYNVSRVLKHVYDVTYSSFTFCSFSQVEDPLLKDHRIGKFCRVLAKNIGYCE